ncbi:tRNA synthetase class I catalytic domain-containing protein [Thozetella sp. PMI_491]|nr:tRNA synthetase class I catalytic domain-containing protein [Thozetella sp. PMI_491]
MSGITVHNSLRPGGPVPFDLKEEGKVSWYACGPTVYDLSHLGHARNYVTADVLRRILIHYFNLEVNYVMNITDIDDKIIIKARRRRLFELEKAKPYTPESAHKLATEAFLEYAKSNLPLLRPEEGLDASNYKERKDAAYSAVLAGGTLSGEGKPGDAEAKLKMHLSNADAAAQALKEGTIFEGAEEILLPYLDSLYKETIDTSDQTIFTDLTQEMERLFFVDMDALNVLRPDHITRVTEYVPQIVSFVEQVIKKGFAYEADGSVYFDIAAFEKQPGNQYARLRPESKNDKALQDEGEGSLSKSLVGKKSMGDFALWKKSKPGEIYYPSPWGNGRPGWHIECSVMASDKLGSQMDVHSGGIDLAFPHHDNELAQSEAYFYEEGRPDNRWVRNFFHMGHLSISGSKMSKSLKNFQTIQDALATTYTSRSMRIVFLMGRWNDGVEVSPDMRLQGQGWENTLDNLFVNVKARLTEAQSVATGVESLSLEGKPDSPLKGDLEKAKAELDVALRNSFDTPSAMAAILRLVKQANISMAEPNVDLKVVEEVARWVTKIVGIFGLDPGAEAPYDGLGWRSLAAGSNLAPEEAVKPYVSVFSKVNEEVKALNLTSESISTLLAQSPSTEFEELEKAGEKDIEKLALPYARAVSRLRDGLRNFLTEASPDAATKQAILALSDRIRDYDLTDLGVQLDDQVGKASLIKFVPAARLIAAREEKLAEAAAKAKQKELARLERERLEAEKLEKAKVSPQEMFKGDSKYIEWDADGLPTKLADGSEVPKSQVKKLKKEWEKQKKVHDDYLAKAGAA